MSEYKRPTEKQIKARARNWQIFRLRGVLANLNILENDIHDEWIKLLLSECNIVVSCALDQLIAKRSPN